MRYQANMTSKQKKKEKKKSSYLPKAIKAKQRINEK